MNILVSFRGFFEDFIFIKHKAPLENATKEETIGKEPYIFTYEYFKKHRGSSLKNAYFLR
jgi:hypothetical protein